MSYEHAQRRDQYALGLIRANLPAAPPLPERPLPQAHLVSDHAPDAGSRGTVMPAEGVHCDRDTPSSQGLELRRLRAVAAAAGHGVKRPGPQRIEASGGKRNLERTSSAILL